jgi:pimeloyl-ACP methyl ester carboxylesterase
MDEISAILLRGLFCQSIPIISVGSPIILVGQGFGAYDAQAIGQKFPRDVVGLILIDPITPSILVLFFFFL